MARCDCGFELTVLACPNGCGGTTVRRNHRVCGPIGGPKTERRTHHRWPSGKRIGEGVATKAPDYSTHGRERG